MSPIDAVKKLEGETCWYVSAGESTAPSFVLVLGKRIPRDAPLRNKAHPPEYRQNRGSHELLVWCSWRLQTIDAVLATSDEEMFVASLRGFIGRTLVSVECSPPAWDLALHFDDGRDLRIFCDRALSQGDDLKNWELWIPGATLDVGPGTAVTFQPW